MLKLTKLTRQQIHLKLEGLLYRIDKERVVKDSIEEIFIDLELCIQVIMHDLESTKRERDFLLKKLGKR